MPDILELDPKRLSKRDADFQKWAKDLVKRGDEAEDEMWRKVKAAPRLLLTAPSVR